MVEDGGAGNDEAGGSFQQAAVKKRTYVQTTFIPSESQQFVPQKKFNQGIDEQ